MALDGTQTGRNTQGASDEGGGGYNALSILIHWTTAFVVLTLYVTGEGDRETRLFHVGAGAILGLFLLWRVARRVARGMTEKPAQAPALNVISSIVLWGLLAAIAITTLTGYLLPWTGGRPIDLFGVATLPSPFPAMPAVHEAFEALHKIASHAFIPLAALHIAGALKHVVVDGDGVFARMVAPIRAGR